MRRKDDTSLLIYAKNIPQSMFDFKPSPKKKTIYITKTGKEKITLSNKEYQFVKAQYKQVREFIWPDKLFQNSLRITSDSLAEFLYKDRSRTVYLISKPIFLRNNTIALAHYTRLCCGGIYGDDHLLYFKKESGKWLKWIFISEGYF